MEFPAMLAEEYLLVNTINMINHLTKVKDYEKINNVELHYA